MIELILILVGIGLGAWVVQKIYPAALAAWQRWTQ